MRHKANRTQIQNYDNGDLNKVTKQIYYQAFHAEQDKVAGAHDSHIPLNPNELFSLPKPYYETAKI